MLGVTLFLCVERKNWCPASFVLIGRTLIRLLNDICVYLSYTKYSTGRDFDGGRGGGWSGLFMPNGNLFLSDYFFDSPSLNLFFQSHSFVRSCHFLRHCKHKKSAPIPGPFLSCTKISFWSSHYFFSLPYSFLSNFIFRTFTDEMHVS